MIQNLRRRLSLKIQMLNAYTFIERKQQRSLIAYQLYHFRFLKYILTLAVITFKTLTCAVKFKQL